MWYFLELFILLSFLQLIFIVNSNGFEPPAKWMKLKKHDPITRIVLLIIIVALYILLIQKLIDVHKFHPAPDFHTLTAVPNTNKYQQLNYRDSNSVANYYYLYESPDHKKETLKALAEKLKMQRCKKACISNFYDDKKAYALDTERLSITKNTVMDQWNKDNYVYVAEHYLGYLGTTGEFSYYPFKDWYYYKHRFDKR